MFDWNGMLIDYSVTPGIIGDMHSGYNVIEEFEIIGVSDVYEFETFLLEHERSERELRSARMEHVSSRTRAWLAKHYDYAICEAAMIDYDNRLAYARDER